MSDSCELPCTATGCTYKTPALPIEFAFRQMEAHHTDVHTSTITNDLTSSKAEKIQRPTFDVEQTNERWE